MTDTEAFIRIGAAALGGLAVGVERQSSGHASGPTARFAGLRTFTLLGGLAGIAGWLWTQGDQLPAALLLASAGALVVAAYAAASRHEVDATTEVAALVVCAAGFLAGAGHTALGSGVVAITVLILVEKSSLHQLVRRLNDEELRAGARFGVMAVVVLPLLPEQLPEPFAGIHPRQLWMLVLLFSGISFAGYAVRRAIGGKESDALAGLLGGLVSSTQVTLVHARASRGQPRHALSLACGAIAASTVLFLRTGLAAALLSPALGQALLPYLAAGLAAGAVASVATLRRSKVPSAELQGPRNPLQLAAAVQMAVVFQLVIALASVLHGLLGEAGLVLSGGIAGLTDVDAATISMARAVDEGVAAAAAAQGVAAGMLANTLLKLALGLVLGSTQFRVAASAGLAAISVAIGALLVLLR